MLRFRFCATAGPGQRPGWLPAISEPGGFARRLIPVLGLLAGFVAAAPAPLSGAPQRMLVMFERAGCAYCQRFDAEVAPLYARTDEGRAAPLRRVDMGAGTPADLALKAPVRFTPTFVLVEDGREIGRITGYMSNESFFGLLAALGKDPSPAGK